MSRQPQKAIPIILILILLITACDAVLGEPIVQIPGMAETLAAQTMTAQMPYQQPATPTSAILHPTTTEIYQNTTADENATISDLQEVVLQSTSTPIPTLTPDPSNPDYPDAPGAIDPNAPCNAAEFIRDVTIPDDSIVKPQEKFTKIWAIRNVGTCTWDKDEYSLVILWGADMGTNRYAPLHFDVPPGTTADLAIDMEAPLVPGCWVSNWMLQDGEGNRFGVGPNYKNYFWVSVSVWWPGVPKFSVG